MKNKPFRKVLSVLMAVLMVISAGVWVAPEEADAVYTTTDINTSLANSVSLNTNVTTVLGSFSGDNSYDDMDGYYKNVLYSPTYSADLESGAAVLSKSIYTGKYYVQANYHHAVTTMMYDGVTAPQTGVYM